jgi:DNA-binding NarL/FixJ family response regulator
MLSMSRSPWASARGAKNTPGAPVGLPPIADPELAAAAALLIGAGYTVTPPAEPDWSPEAAHLSQREQQVASLLIEGASNKVIARALDISVHTAKFHVAAILEKLGARNRADAVSIILREGLVAL